MAENDVSLKDGAAEEQDEIAEALIDIFRRVGENSVNGEISTAANRTSDHPFHGGYQATPQSPDSFGSTSGIALFMAAYHLATKDQRAREMAIHSASRLRPGASQVPVHSGIPTPHEHGSGGLAGVGSMVFAFVQLAAWLKMPEFLDSAREAVASITPGRIMTEERLDVTCGCAGTLLALLSFIEKVTAMDMDSGSAPDLALLCGRRLLEKRVSDNSGPRAWPAVDSLPNSGFAHGAAGIAYALVRLFQFTGREEFRDAAVEGFAFERTLYAPQIQSWFDARRNLAPEIASHYRDASGVALGILGSIVAIDSHALRHDLEQVLSISRTLPESAVDHLCCGNFARVETMHVAGNVLGRLQLSAHARHLAIQLLTRAATSGFRFQPSHHQCNSSGTDVSHHPLFVGLAGVGYTLLRLNYPNLFPSMLLMETVV